MATNKCTGANKKQPKMRKSVRMQKEHPPNGGIVYPSCSENQFPETSSNRYTKPQMHSVLQQVQEIENIEAMKALHIKNTTELTPRSKSAIIPKITQKLNFDANKRVFKNLPSLNVNDSILLPKEPRSIRKTYITNSSKILAPELCDFLDPLPPLKHIIPIPDIKLELPKLTFDFCDTYEFLKDLELLKGEKFRDEE